MLVCFRKKDSKKYTAKQVNDYLLWTLADTLLYAHFNRTFWERVEMMGVEDFMKEVKDLDVIQNKSLAYCDNVLDGTMSVMQPLRFQKTKWNPDFEITKYDCLLIKSKTGMRDELKQQYDEDPVQVVQPPVPKLDWVELGC